jgi:thiamine-monophosphate kinase
MIRTTGFRRRIRLGPGTEFDLIGSLLGADDLPPEVVVGPGDDCAVLEGGRWAVSCDLSLEGVHFRRDWLSIREIGYRAAAAALSDLAAVAAAPVASLVSYGLTPEDVESDAARELHRGVEEACGQVGAVVVGGDLSSSPTVLVVDVVVLGRADAPVLRDGARVGDDVWVTGGLGGAGAALRVLLQGSLPEPALRSAYAHPVPRVREAIWLAERESLHALIDLSDGLGADAGHVAAASGVGIVLEAVRLPVAPRALRVAAGERVALELALSAGDDYELCMAAAPGALEELRDDFESTFSLPLTRVGRVVEGRGVYLDSGDGEPEPLHDAGYDHIAGRGGTGK